MEQQQAGICQSCGMPLSKDPEHGGTNADGSKSVEYCGYCYRDGHFTQDVTAEQMRDFVKNLMMERGMDEATAAAYTAGIPQLKRWQ